jgi:hypothetical protein
MRESETKLAKAHGEQIHFEFQNLLLVEGTRLLSLTIVEKGAQNLNAHRATLKFAHEAPSWKISATTNTPIVVEFSPASHRSCQRFLRCHAQISNLN